MSDTADRSLDVAVLAPTGRDGPLAEHVLTRWGIRTTAHGDAEALAAAIQRGVGAVLVVEEALVRAARERLLAELEAQPPWSDVPLIVLTAEGELSRSIAEGIEVLAKRGNVTLLERPVRVATLVTALRSALRARERQYEVRDIVRELRAAREAADAANRAKSSFLATMSHEIRTPINAVLGYAELLVLGVAGRLTADQRQYVERITASARHLRGVVEDVLDVARVESGRLKVARDPGDLLAVIEGALGLVRPQAAARGLRIGVECEAPGGIEFVGDEIRVRQILVNLLANAVKFTDPIDPRHGSHGTPAPGGAPTDDAFDAPPTEIVVTCGVMETGDPRLFAGATVSVASGWAFVRVQDVGIGIAADRMEAIFEPFVQVEGGHTRTRGGSGLGLAISRQLARLMGGDLTAESSPGHGSAFTLWLPGEVSRIYAGGSAWRGTRGIDAGLAEREALEALGLWLAAHAERLTAGFAERLRADPRVPVARSLSEMELRDHISTYLIDIAKAIGSAERSDEPMDVLQDGIEIQQLISERHGTQRFRLGFTETMLACELELLRVHLVEVLRVEAPAAAGPALDRGVELLTLFLDQAERIARRAFRHAAETAPRSAPEPVNPGRA